MARKKCLTEEEICFRTQRLMPPYKAQKDNEDGWGDNGEVWAFYCFRLYGEVQRLRELAQTKSIEPGPDQDWFHIPTVGPGTDRVGEPAAPSRR